MTSDVTRHCPICTGPMVEYAEGQWECTKCRRTLPRYAWVITRDFIADGKDDPTYAVGTAGPSWATAADIERARKEGRTFRLLDDDGIVYYHGKVWYAEDVNEDDGNPLEDFGMPNAGAVTLEYRVDDDGGWALELG